MTPRHCIKAGPHQSELRRATDQSLPSGAHWRHDIELQLAAPVASVCLAVGVNVAQASRPPGLHATYPMHHFDSPKLFCNTLFMSRQHWSAAR
jgi:hypothetical protein